MTIISKTLSELAVGDIIVDPQGVRHRITQPIEQCEENGDGFYPELKGTVKGFTIYAEHEYEGNVFLEERRVFPASFEDPDNIKFAIEVP